MSAPIVRYAELLKRLSRLPETGPDHVRVFRGQTSYHPKMLPSGLRPNGIFRKHIWRSYMQAIAFGMPRASSEVADSPLFNIWIEAMAQHYGTGSRFLDVTCQLEIALWFALHEAQEEVRWEPTTTPHPFREVQRLFGGKVEASTEVLVAHRTTRYSPMTDRAGWLYVFDVPR